SRAAVERCRRDVERARRPARHAGSIARDQPDASSVDRARAGSRAVAGALDRWGTRANARARSGTHQRTIVDATRRWRRPGRPGTRGIGTVATLERAAGVRGPRRRLVAIGALSQLRKPCRSALNGSDPGGGFLVQCGAHGPDPSPAPR